VAQELLDRADVVAVHQEVGAGGWTSPPRHPQPQVTLEGGVGAGGVEEREPLLEAEGGEAAFVGADLDPAGAQV
jgi:hypothetical protein